MKPLATVFLATVLLCACVAPPAPTYDPSALTILLDKPAAISVTDRGCNGAALQAQALPRAIVQGLHAALAQQGFVLVTDARRAHDLSAEIDATIYACRNDGDALRVVLSLNDNGVLVARSSDERADYAAIARQLRASEALAGRAHRKSPSPVQALRTPAKMVVLPFTAQGGVGVALPRLCASVLLGQLDNVRGLKTIGQDDMQAMLGLDRQRQLLGCDTTSCIAELGGALGAELVMHGEVGKVGNTLNLNVSIVRTQSGAVAARASRLVNDGEDALVAQVADLVPELVGKLNR